MKCAANVGEPAMRSGELCGRSAADAKSKIKAGADLVQIYTGLVYHGPGLVPKIAKALKG